MKKKNSLILILPLALMVLGGCAHCSVTVTKFDGKTTGINPHGAGKIKVVREAYWGNLKCILKLLKKEVVE